jgi:hypothetical protein
MPAYPTGQGGEGDGGFHMLQFIAHVKQKEELSCVQHFSPVATFDEQTPSFGLRMTEEMHRQRL